MYSIVKVLRIRGHRHSDREIGALDGTAGNLIACRIADVHQMGLVDPVSGSALVRLNLPLYEPQIGAMRGGHMLLRGFERASEEPLPTSIGKGGPIELVAW
jgi:hypothetical protein